MNTYRLIERLRAADVLAGDCAAVSGGRWNARGCPAIYTSLTVSLAILELRCHFPERFQCESYCLATLHIPDADVQRLDRGTLPRSWRSLELCTRREGERWLRSGQLALQVPSVVHPFEDNIVINPRHPRFHTVRVLAMSAIDVDPRIHH